MKITMLLENCPYPRDVRVRREARALTAAGHRVTVIAPRAPGERRREAVDGVEVRRFRVPAAGASARGTALEYAVALPALHLAAIVALIRGADVLHLHNPPDLLFGAALLARVLGRHVVYDQHDLFPELVAEKVGPGIGVRLARWAEWLTFRLASRVLAANESHAGIARGRGGVRPERIAVVRNGPPAATIAAQPALREGPLDDPELVYVGMLGSQDGVAALAEILALVRGEHGLAKATLTVVGDGDDRSTVEAALHRAGVATAATITGWVDPPTVRARLEAADICVDPSPPTPLNEHSTMIKIGEYLAAGKPIVAYDLLETRHTSGGAASLVTPGDPAAMAAAIADFARDPEARLRSSEAALRRAPAISWEHSVSALLDTYASLARAGA